MRYCLFILLSLLSIVAKSQSIISGTVADSLQNPVHRASVTYGKVGSKLILGFSQTDENGIFKLPVSITDDRISISIKHLAYKEVLVNIKNETASHRFILQLQPLTLSAVHVKSPPVYKRNDTLNYNIEDFGSKQDRVIGDVIKRLPGIEVDGNKILYQGKPIQQYLINGLDLLEGRYALANENLPVEAVKKVQVIENHQPIKILDSALLSNRASLNIQLKKFTTTGTVKTGAGGGPAVWEVNLTPMTFNKNFQSISSIQTNNLGLDVSGQLKNQGSGANVPGAFNMADFNPVDLPSYFSIQSVSSPPLQENRWLDNHVGLVAANFLQNLKRGYELKSSFSYVTDFRKRKGYTNSLLYTPEQTVALEETTNNSYAIDKLKGDIILTKNSKKIYLKNAVKVTTEWNKTTGQLFINSTDSIFQQNHFNKFGLSNGLTAIKNWGKSLVTFSSFSDIGSAPQSLVVRPGLYQTGLNGGLDYKVGNQNLKLNHVFTNNYVSFIKAFHAFTIVPGAGLSFQGETLQSALQLDGERLKKGFTNALDYNLTTAHTDLKTQYKNQNWKMELNMPLNWKFYRIRDKELHIENAPVRLTFEPSGYFIYKPGEKVEIGINSAYTRNIGGISELYNNYLLTNYRTLQKFNNVLPESSNLNNLLSVEFKNANHASFSRVYYNNNAVTRNFFYKNIVDSKGFNTIERVAGNNRQQSHNAGASTSKFWENLQTVLKITGNISYSNSSYLINEKPGAIKTNGSNLGLNVYNTSFEFLALSYDGQLGYVSNSIDGHRTEPFVTGSHKLEVDFFPAENHIITVNCLYYSIRAAASNQPFFLDLNYKVKLPSKKIDIELSYFNMLNTRNFIRLNATGFVFTSDYFELRPRQFLVSINYRF